MSRSLYKGSFFKINLLKQKNWIKIYNKNLQILPEYKNAVFYVYNGKNYVKLEVKKEMIGFKFGEFIHTKKRHIYKKKK